MPQYFELCRSINKQGAYRLIRNAKTKKDIQDFVKEFVETENLYMSVYTFTELEDGNKPFYPSAVCDKIFIEFDNEGHGLISDQVWFDLKKLLDWCVEEERLSGDTLRPQVFFSGGSGYHVIFTLNQAFKELKNNKVVQKVGEKLKYLSGCKLIDMNANHGFSQLRRIPNTKNHKTGFYCVPLTLDEAYNLSPDSIIKLASKPRKFSNDIGESTYFTKVIKFVADTLQKLELVKKQEPSKYNTFRDTVIENNLQRIRPCIFRLMQQHNPGFDQRTWIACEMIRCKWNDHHIHNVFKNFNKYDYEMTNHHLKRIRDKGLWAPSCRYLEEKGYCKPEYHIKAGVSKV